MIVGKIFLKNVVSIFILSRMEGYTSPEIANMLNLSLRTVENQIYRALKVLKARLENYL